MEVTDWIGFMGVSLLLIAYFLNLNNKMAKDSISYLMLNFTGAGIACFASVLLHYLPFVILEGCWTLVSAMGIIHYFRKK
jgi:hypothetical protein